MQMTVSRVMQRIFSRGRDVVRTDALDATLQAYDDLWRGFPWPFRIMQGQVTAVADVTTGTVAIVRATKTMTFSTDPGVSAVGRYVRLNGGLRAYRVVLYSGGIHTVDAPVEEATDTVATYELREMDFKLPPNFDLLHTSVSSAGLSWVELATLREMERDLADPWSLGTPQMIAPCGSTTQVLYNTGAVTTTRGLDTITLVGGSWDATYAGRRFLFREQPELGWYVLKSVDSTTTGTLDRMYMGRPGSGQLYDIDPAGEPLVRLYPQPEANTSVMFSYYRALPPLPDVDAWPELPPHYHEAWCKRALLILGLESEAAYQKEIGLLKGREGLGRFGVIRAGTLGLTGGGGGKGILPDGFPYYRGGGR